MHVHYNTFMRTTIDLPDEYRATLHSIAAKRGWKGYSRIIQEAVDLYVRNQAQADADRRVLLTRQGAWRPVDASEVRATIAEVRKGWKRRSSATPMR
jgi:predicted transcriptional regulator